MLAPLVSVFPWRVWRFAEGSPFSHDTAQPIFPTCRVWSPGSNLEPPRKPSLQGLLNLPHPIFSNLTLSFPLNLALANLFDYLLAGNLVEKVRLNSSNLPNFSHRSHFPIFFFVDLSALVLCKQAQSPRTSKPSPLSQFFQSNLVFFLPFNLAILFD